MVERYHERRAKDLQRKNQRNSRPLNDFVRFSYFHAFHSETPSQGPYFLTACSFERGFELHAR